MIIGADRKVTLHIAFDLETFEISITNENAKNVAQMQMILDEAVRSMADKRQELMQAAAIKALQDQMMHQQIMASVKH